MYQDWFKVWRKITDSKVFANPHIFKLWVLCLRKANWTDRVILWEGANEQIHVKRGQFVTGRESLHADYYKVSRGSRKTSRTIWRWLKTLESWQCLRLESVQGVTLVTLCNYGTYQDGSEKVSNLVTKECPDDVQDVSRMCPGRVQMMSTEEEGKEAQEGKEASSKEKWVMMTTLLRELGVMDAEVRVATAQQRQLTPDYIRALIDHYNAHPGAWQPAALRYRIEHGHPDESPNAWWPEISDGYCKQKRQAAQDEQARQRQASDEEARQEQKKDDAELARLEQSAGKELDAMSDDDAERLARAVLNGMALTLYLKSGRSSPLARPALLEYLASEQKPKT